MTITGVPCPRAVLAAALASLTALYSAAAAGAAPPPGIDAVTERVREILREDRGDAVWGADPPAEETAARGEPFAATDLSGSGHAMLVIGKDGRPMGSHLRLLHVSVEGARASASDCVLRLGNDEDRSCPPAPLALVDCATWSVPADAARAVTLAARAALFVRVYEKKFIADPRQESEDGSELGMTGSVSGGSSADFVAVANVMESGEHPIRVVEEWAGYASSYAAGRYARAAAATEILREAFPRPSDAPASAPPPAVHAEFSRLLATLPLDDDFWWWVRERMVLMAAALGLPADLARLERYLTPKGKDPSDLRTRAYALEALARRTRRDPRCDGGRRLADPAAAAAWRRAK
ncbi:MAG TPA: hypothetical protein VGX68_23170 [Thermoanaerobaculia bacterium]|jgi:hypothetical protein|nr:hypothetical protein [Thermoanaerobaculia bacterium]